MAASKLTKTIGLLYRMQRTDVERLYRQLLEIRKVTYATALRQMAREHGCGGTPNAPRREDLAELKRMSREDAKSISATWNRDVARQIEALYEANPRGNRQYYFSNLERWNAERNRWKLPQIALVTDTTTTEYARQRFREMNYPGGEKFIFTGPPPTCPDCMERFAAGIVGEAYTRRYSCPRHIGCPHTYVALNPPQIPCNELWLG